MNEFAFYLLLVLAGFLAGIINTIAGGGSFLTLPALLLFGLDPQAANATNRIAILMSTGSATVAFHRKGYWDHRLALRLGTPILLGVPFGTALAIYLPADSFRQVFGVLFLAMAGLLVSNPKRLLDAPSQPKLSARWQLLAFFAIGIYVGFIQAGFGILMLLAMGFFCDTNLVSSNAIKSSIGFVVTLSAAIFFAFYGLIEWVPGLFMAFGNVLGGITGAKLAIEKGSRFVFYFLVVVMTVTGFKLVLT
ncbi:hypothetical protein SAMN06265222_11236 [Neorhodopirellula lusitana]|uniref:Probable membrane transporter protein n=1 Tax=Neorhodopirellula lusitana TaxID=445327 RepID=A0ABY1QHA0_9BACT|nr:sulfite exporter TauE/SafE family protein [Neorhodopirellula lusitana]SMP69421.1 hypothetical protein SAMN06265222_11236 [Neorhodopirellula lusitana]